ncbi:MAG: hypothetical protein EP343_17310 [Deltaproteobacteria bacterium]|nr:MAG: hypothetical protein EP343_17310 [Deltaproteobacteria bacterium]
MKRWLLRVVGFGVCCVVLLCLLFVWNSGFRSWSTPGLVKLPFPEQTTKPKTLRVMAFNIAHGFSRRGFRFKQRALLLKHLDKVAALIRKSQADVVFLSEVDLECTPCGVKQLRYLAKQAQYPFVVSGENYNFGIPWFRIRAGLGILSKYRLSTDRVEQLPGTRPFYSPAGNRRILWAYLHLGKQRVKVASIHNESHSPENNLNQVRVILRKLDKTPALLAGDFNCTPNSASMKRFRQSGLFRAAWNGEASFPAKNITIDYILAPRSWKLLKHHVIPTKLSDHYPVVSLFQLSK